MLGRNGATDMLLGAFSSAVVVRILSIGASVVTAPIVFQALGTDRFGLWMTLLSLSSLVSLADLGVGSAAQNRLSSEIAYKNEIGIKAIVSSSTLMLAGAAAVVAIIFAGVSAFSVEQMSISEEAGLALLLVAILSALMLPLSPVIKLLFASNRAHEVYLYNGLITGVVLGGTVLITSSGGGMIAIASITLGAPILVWSAVWVKTFWFDLPAGRPSLLAARDTEIVALIKVGMPFMLIQALAFAGVGVDNLLIASILDPADVAPYAVMNRIWSSLFVVQFITSALWPALAKLLAIGDLPSARRLFQRSVFICTALGVGLAVVLVLLSQAAIAVWIGEPAVPDMLTVLGFAGWSIVAAANAPIAALLSTGKGVKSLLALLTVAAGASLVLKALLIPTMGASGAVLASCIGYSITLPTGFLQCARLLKSIPDHKKRKVN